MKNMIYRSDADTLIFWACLRMGLILDEADAQLRALPLTEALAEKRRRHLVMKRIHEAFSQASAALIAYMKSDETSLWMQEEVVAHLPSWISELLQEWDGFLKETLQIVQARPGHPAQANYSTLFLCYTLFSDIYEVFGQTEPKEVATF